MTAVAAPTRHGPGPRGPARRSSQPDCRRAVAAGDCRRRVRTSPRVRNWQTGRRTAASTAAGAPARIRAARESRCTVYPMVQENRRAVAYGCRLTPCGGGLSLIHRIDLRACCPLNEAFTRNAAVIVGHIASRLAGYASRRASSGDLRFWRRRHRHGESATVSELVPDWSYLAGAPSTAVRSPYLEIRGLREARQHADRVSGCPQPCDCPVWVEVLRPVAPPRRPRRVTSSACRSR